MNVRFNLKSWIQAARLRTLPLALSGILLASLIAYSNEIFDLTICILAITTTLLLQILSNFANDYGDYSHGTDNKDRVGPERTLQSGALSPKSMKMAIYFTGFLAFSTGILLLILALDQVLSPVFIIFLLIGIAAIGAAIKYTVGKNNFGYVGLGDLMVFIFFGLASVSGTHFLMVLKFDWIILLPASAIGLLSSGVLNVNNMRDIENDKNSGKITLAVRLGIKKSKIYHAFLILLSLILFIAYTNLIGKAFIGLSLFIPYSLLMFHLTNIFKAKSQKELDPELKRLSLSTLLVSLWLGFGLIL